MTLLQLQLGLGSGRLFGGNNVPNSLLTPPWSTNKSPRETLSRYRLAPRVISSWLFRLAQAPTTHRTRANIASGLAVLDMRGLAASPAVGVHDLLSAADRRACSMSFLPSHWQSRPLPGGLGLDLGVLWALDHEYWPRSWSYKNRLASIHYIATASVYCLDPMVGCIADTVAVHVFLSAADCSACSTVQSCPRVLFFILCD